jgi:hypothetical protein
MIKGSKCEVSFNGQSLGSFDGEYLFDDPSDSRQDVPGLVDFMNMVRLEPVVGSFTATATTKWAREDADKFFAALEARLPKPQVRQIGLAIELGGTQPIKVGLPDGRSFTGKGWSKIGTARSSHTQQRLRKFVKRGDKLIEVRARGRTGSRVLQEAVLQAGVEGCFGNEFTVEGTYG